MADDATMFRLLGPVACWHDGHEVDLGPARQRGVLAVLLLEANRCVSVDQLVERVWAEARRPDHPRKTVQTYLSFLRGVLTPIPHVAINRQSAGYVLDVDEHLVDVHEFHRLVAEGTPEPALALWHGEAFAGLHTPWLDGARTALDRARQAAERDLTDLHLRQGRHDALLPRLTEWADEYPLDERLIGQLMLAQFRSGKQADALLEYQRLRHRLADEMGVDPGPAVQQLYQRMLRQDPELDTPVQTTAARAVTPRQLPAPPRAFAGRQHELALLDKALDDRTPGELVLTTISGVGGIGKTWLALHWAHQHADRFPDGQLYVNLRGFDPTGNTTSTQAAVRGFLDALGVEPSSVPADVDAGIGLYRSLVADRRVLIVLDNARDTAQVAQLLPGSPSCTVLVTGRGRLSGLVTAHGADTLGVDVLAEPEARALLAARIGTERLAAEPAAVAELLACCGGLPLALSIVAGRATAHPDFALAELAAELRDATTRLGALADGDPATSLPEVLSWSHHALTEQQSSVFLSLGTAPGPDIGLAAAASLTAQPIERVRAVLRELDNASLAQEHAPGRYRMHDLVRLYATDRAGADRTALRRVVDFYLHTTYAAARRMFPIRPPIHLPPPVAGVVPLAFPNTTAALAWLDTEHPSLMACLHRAADQGWHDTVWQLAWSLDDFHLRRALFADLFTAWETGLAATERHDDPTVRALAHRRFGDACSRVGRYADAVVYLQLALDLNARTDDRYGRASANQALAEAWSQRGDDQRAYDHASRALELYAAPELAAGRSRAHNQVAWYAAHLGLFDEADRHCRAALALCREFGDHVNEADTLDSLGYIAYRTGQHAKAVDHYWQAVRLYRDHGYAQHEADTLDRIGEAHAAAGRPDQARDAWRQALALYRTQHRAGHVDRVQRRLGG